MSHGDGSGSGPSDFLMWPGMFGPLGIPKTLEKRLVHINPIYYVWIILVFIVEFRFNFSENNVLTAIHFFPFEMRHELINLYLLNGCGCNTGQTVGPRENFQFAKALLPLHNF